MFAYVSEFFDKTFDLVEDLAIILKLTRKSFRTFKTF